MNFKLKIGEKKSLVLLLCTLLGCQCPDVLPQAAPSVQLGTICSADALLERRFCRVFFAIHSFFTKFLQSFLMLALGMD